MVVGALAAVLQGAPVSTLDIETVHRPDPANVRCLAVALRSVNAFYWEHRDRRLEPEKRALALPSHHVLQTDLGRMVIPGVIGHAHGCEQLKPQAEQIDLAAGLTITVLGLEAIVATKRATGRPKDLAILPVLEEPLRAAQGGKAEDPGPGALSPDEAT